MLLSTRVLVFIAFFWITISLGKSQVLRASEVAQQSPYSTQTGGLQSPTSDSGSPPRSRVYKVKIGGDHTVILPSGIIIEPDGTVITRNGFKYQIIVRNGAFIGIQIYRSNGRKLNPGESLLLKNGRVVTQQPL